jgi:putative ABC transport system permease protein
VRTGATAGADTAAQINQGISGFTTVLSVFGYIALFVGSFIIINTFSILLAQRQRELALLRALGASRKQLRRSVLGEAFVTGLFASIVGVGFGIVVAIGLKAAFNAAGASFPPSPIVVKPASLIIPLVLGVLITCLAAYMPARRAAKVPPVAAMRETLPANEERMGRRIITGAIVLVVGAAVLAAGLFTGAGIALVGLGALLAFVGVTVLVPLVARPLSSVLGAPLGAIGPASQLGRGNAMRNPRRTASTASALLVGLALVGAVTTIGASLKASFTHIIDTSVKADYVVGTQNSTISPEAATRIEQEPSVASVAAIRTGFMQIDGDVKSVSGVNAGGASLVSLKMKQGSVSALDEGKVLIDDKAAKKNHFTVGQQLPVVFARTGPTTLTVGGTYDSNPLAGNYLVGNSVLEGKFATDDFAVVLAKAKPGQLTAAKTAIDKVAKDFPNVSVKNQVEFKQEQKKQIDGLLTMVLFLLALSVAIALIGIVNTLALSVVERTREIGLLRAVGMQRRQVSRMIRSEAVIVALMGSIIGLLVGVILARALVAALSDTGIDQFAVPVGRLILYLIVAGVFGVVAAIFPARRANKLDVLKAVTTD